MATMTVYIYEDQTTLERGYTSNPIDMPISETTDRKEYLIKTEDFLQDYAKWDRNAYAMLAVNDELSGLELFLSQHQAERIKKAIGERKDSIDLSEIGRR